MAAECGQRHELSGPLALDDQGPVVIYHAKDANAAIRRRMDSLCAHRELDLESLPLYTITSPTLRLDLEADCATLSETVCNYLPKLLLLDPLGAAAAAFADTKKVLSLKIAC